MHLFPRLCVLVLLVVVASAGRDFYKVLGLSRDATSRQIKKAFRKMSVKYHPDKNRGNAGAAKKFQEVAEAYEILSDEEKKFVYDEGGEEALNEEKQGGGGGMDPFSMFFGGGGQKRGRKKNKSPDANVEIGISLADLFNGKEVTAQMSRLVHCKGCKGKRSGKCAKCTARCPNEIRMVQRQVGPGFMVNTQQEVPSKEKCEMAAVDLTVMLERGMPDGHVIDFRNKGEQHPGKIPGDVHLKLKQQDHPTFKRKGKNLHLEMTISLREALVGFSRSIPQLDGSTVTFETTDVTPPFTIRKIVGEGMPVHNFPSQRGDMYIKFIVKFPSTLNAMQRKKVAAVF